MAKVKYYYDSETLSYKKIETKKNFLLSRFFASFITFGLAMVLGFVVLSYFFETPHEKELKRELEYLKLNESLHGKRIEQFEDVKREMSWGVKIERVMSTLSRMLRPSLVAADGNTFVVGDWSAIEARALPWLTDSKGGEQKLDLFREGIDVYVETAKSIGSDSRQIGKVCDLSLGYGGAAGAFSAMATNYGVDLPDYQVARIVKNWHRSNKWCTDFWKEVEQAAKKAIRSGGKAQFKAGRVVYTYAPALMGGTLICILPDGSLIQYPHCKIEYSDKGDNIVALKASVRPKADSEDNWGKVRLWGGLMVENITQAFCAGLLRYALRELDGRGLTIVGHVHDEIIAECSFSHEEETKKVMQNIMEFTPPFAKGLPLKAVPVSMVRYGNH